MPSRYSGFSLLHSKTMWAFIVREILGHTSQNEVAVNVTGVDVFVDICV